MAYRYIPIPLERLTEEQKDAHHYLDQVTGKMFGQSGEVFDYKDEHGAFTGPMAPLLRTPELAKTAFEAVGAVSRIPGLSSRSKELVIIATGAAFQTRYELYAHGRISEAKTGFGKQQVVDASSGKTPADLSQAETTAYEVAFTLAKAPGALDKNAFERAERDLGKEGTLALIHYTGFYAWMCILMNAADVPIVAHS